MAEVTVEKKSLIAKIQLVFKGLKSEWMKIVFPSKENIMYSSIVVIVCSFVIGFIIFVFDIIISNGLSFVLK
ncbi:MAG: preprotein translocase subunit SecE [Lachnospiraceae bacterium]|nr:preprotein translocase subunit SecE [Lachnospiraceae bacterium]